MEDSNRKKSALILSTSVAFYIIAGIILIASEELFGSQSEIGNYLAMIICIFPTSMLVYRKKVYPVKKIMRIREEDAELSQEGKRNRLILRFLSAGLWISLSVLYMVVSPMTDAWSITWLIFVAAFFLQNSLSYYFRDKIV